MINNLAINQSTGDLLESAGQIKQVTELDAVSQSIYSDLSTFLAEYWLNKYLGVPYFEVIFIKSVDLSIKKTILKNQILKNKHVIEVTKFESNFLNTSRKLNIIFSAITTYGNIENLEVSV